MTTKLDFIRIKNFIDGEWIEEKDVEYVPLYNQPFHWRGHR